MATIKDVAKLAGVSITTVSHVINETRYVSDELKGKVFRAMKDLDYRPNTLARGLRSGKTKTIGLIIPDISNPYFAEFSRKIEDRGFEHGYNVILCNSDENPEKEILYIDVLFSKQVDGLIIFSTGNNSFSQLNLIEHDIPIVVTDREPRGFNSDVVLIDNFKGGYSATNYLISLGHRRIGCISGPSLIRPSAQRVEGYLKALEEVDIQIDENIIRLGDFRVEGGEKEMSFLMDVSDPPTAVFVCNDVMALGAMRAIQRKGKRVPEDVSIVGFDNIPVSRLVYPQLTTISQPIQEMAELAVELLIDKIKLKENQKYEKVLNPQFNRIVLDTELVVRGSCTVLKID